MSDMDPGQITSPFDVRWSIAMHSVLDRFEAYDLPEAENALRGQLERVGSLLNDPKILEIAQLGTRAEVFTCFRTFVCNVEARIIEI